MSTIIISKSKLYVSAWNACCILCFSLLLSIISAKTFTVETSASTFCSKLGPVTSSSSVLADGDSGDSVAADPRNNGTPDTSEKGVNGDA